MVFLRGCPMPDPVDAAHAYLTGRGLFPERWDLEAAITAFLDALADDPPERMIEAGGMALQNSVVYWTLNEALLDELTASEWEMGRVAELALSAGLRAWRAGDE